MATSGSCSRSAPALLHGERRFKDHRLVDTNDCSDRHSAPAESTQNVNVSSQLFWWGDLIQSPATNDATSSLKYFRRVETKHIGAFVQLVGKSNESYFQKWVSRRICQVISYLKSFLMLGISMWQARKCLTRLH